MRPRVTRLRPSDFKRTPWKNGLGWTDQIAISPPEADLRRGDFDWRLSTARITQSADFSPFPEHDRVLVVLEGAGVSLTHRFEEGGEPERVELPPGEPYEFPGDVPTHCELKDGPIQDLSVFLRKGSTQALVERVDLKADEPHEWEPQGRACFVFVAHGELQVELRGEGNAMSLRAGEALRLDWVLDPASGQLPSPVRLASNSARVILIQLDST